MTSVDPPDWFLRALAVPYNDHRLAVDGTGIAYRTWGEPGRPGLVFVHGGAANLHWWDHVAPLFADEYRVVALDMSGHGDSDRRDTYPLEAWADEIVAVADDSAMAGRPIIVGHSMGGFITLATAALHPDALAGAMTIDSPVVREDPEVEAARVGNEFKPPRVYDTAETMVGRFRTVPEQDHYEPYVMDHVARHSIVAVDGGFTWKFDNRVFGARRSQIADLLPSITCRIALFRAEHGLATEEVGAFMYEQLGRVSPVVLIPDAGHHVMLDRPLLLVTGIRSLLADWEHSHPYVRRDTD